MVLTLGKKSTKGEVNEIPDGDGDVDFRYFTQRLNLIV
jgi:hypothetical protein